MAGKTTVEVHVDYDCPFVGVGGMGEVWEEREYERRGIKVAGEGGGERTKYEILKNCFEKSINKNTMISSSFRVI